MPLSNAQQCHCCFKCSSRFRVTRLLRSFAASAAQVFRMDDDDEPLVQANAQSNTLSLVLRDSGVMRFVKYVGAAAPGSRWDVAGEFEVNMDEDDSPSGEGSEGEEAGDDDGQEAVAEEQ